MSTSRIRSKLSRLQTPEGPWSPTLASVVAAAAIGTPWTARAIAARIRAVVETEDPRSGPLGEPDEPALLDELEEGEEDEEAEAAPRAPREPRLQEQLLLAGRDEAERLALTLLAFGPPFRCTRRQFERKIGWFVAQRRRAGAHWRRREPPATIPRPGLLPGLPPLPDLGALAALLGVTPAQLSGLADLNGRAATSTEAHHRPYWLFVVKTGSKLRVIEAPKWRRKGAQRVILREILDRTPTSPWAHGFVKGRDIGSAATPHAGAEVVVRVDLRDFFPSIPRSRVAAMFSGLGYPPDVALHLAGICVARSRDPRAPRLSAWHLPQGAPSSPAIANLIARRLDTRLAGLAERLGLTYTRYADDLVLSGPSRALRRGILVVIRRIIEDEGFRVHPDKIRWMGASHRQEVCGLVVNAYPQPSRAEFDQLKAILHNARASGLETQNRAGHADMRAWVVGRIGWITRWNPRRGEVLRRMLAEVEA